MWIIGLYRSHTRRRRQEGERFTYLFYDCWNVSLKMWIHSSIEQSAVKGKGKGLGTCYNAAYMSRLKTSSASQFLQWQLVGMS